jgi:hypothetical protein
MMISLCDGSIALLGIMWVCVARCWQTWRDSIRTGTLCVKRLATVRGSCPSAWIVRGGKRLTMLHRQLVINHIPLCL